MDGDGFRAGSEIEKDELLVVSEDTTGYTIDYIGDDGAAFEMIIVWEDRKLRDRIVELLNKYGESD
jgi:hypothetical protein